MKKKRCYTCANEHNCLSMNHLALALALAEESLGDNAIFKVANVNDTLGVSTTFYIL